jgi:hypothetical protein
MFPRDLKSRQKDPPGTPSRLRPDDGDLLDWQRSLAGAADALLVFFPALALVRKLDLPQIASTTDVVSATTRAGFETLTNYAQFALCVLVVWLAFFAGFRRGRPALGWIAKLPENYLRMSRGRRTFFWVLGTAASLVYLVNITSVTLDAPLTDLYHEGEYLGFIPALAAPDAVFASTFMAHGPGVDLLPGFVAARFVGSGHGIVATRLAYAALRTVAVVTSLLAVLVFARLLSPEARRARWIASSALALMIFVVALQIGAWTDVPTFHKTMNPRDAGFLLQVLAVLVLALAERRRWHPLGAAALAVAIGASLPLAILYSYDRGLYGVVFLLLVSAAFAACGGRSGRIWLTGLAAGAVLGSAAVYAVFGRQDLEAVREQVAFWVRHGRAIWAYAGLVALPDTWTGAVLIGSFIALALGAARVVRVITATRSVREAIAREIGVVILMSASIACWRMPIERGDAGHVAWGVTASWIMLSVFVARFALDALRSSPRFDPVPRASGATNYGASIVMVGASAIAGCNLLFLDPYAAYDRLANQYYGGLQKTDATILSAQQLRTLDAIRNDLGSSSCFYTLTNEGAWYYLLHAKSCSRFYQLTNARPVSAQREIVAALEATKPGILLFSSGGWSSTVVDGVSMFNASAEVMRYVLSHYVPWKFVAGNWFWQRSDEPLRFSDRSEGAIADAPSVGNRASDVRLSGTYGSDRATARPKALIVTDDDENAPLWAGQPAEDELLEGRWSAEIPTAALAPGNHRVRVWAFGENGAPLVQLGTDVDFHLE